MKTHRQPETSMTPQQVEEIVAIHVYLQRDFVNLEPVDAVDETNYFNCIYLAISPRGLKYVGQTQNLFERHKKYHYKNCKGQTKLFAELSQYGFKEFTVKILATDIPSSLLDQCETAFINKYDSFSNGLNGTRIGGSVRGVVWSDIQKKNQSKSMKKFHTEHPEVQAEWSRQKIEYHKENPEVSKIHQEKLKLLYDRNPERKIHQSIKAKQAYENNPALSKKISDALKLFYEENPNIRDEKSIRLKEAHKNNPLLGKNHSDKLKKLHIDNPELAKLRGEKVKKFFRDNPQAKSEISLRVKKHRRDHPELSLQQSERQRKYIPEYEINQFYIWSKVEPISFNKNNQISPWHFECNRLYFQEHNRRSRQ